MVSNGSWEENRKFLLFELGRLSKQIEEISKTQTQILNDISSLKTRASMWGGIFGAIGAAVISLLIQIVF